MSWLDFLVVLGGFLLIYTKWLDVKTTLEKVRSVSLEANPVARFFMRKWGIKRAAYLIFGFIIVVVIGVSVTGIFYGNGIFKSGLIVIFFLVSFIQWQVARYNETGHSNGLINFIHRVYRKKNLFFF